MTELAREEDHLYQRVADILDSAQSLVARTVNTAMVHAYWHVGREIIEVEQRGQDRANYGEQLITNLAARLGPRFGRGMSVVTLRRIRRFYLAYPNGTQIPRDFERFEIRSTVLTKLMSDKQVFFPTSLSWSHYMVLIRVEDEQARAFYEIEAVKESWSIRELERQISSLLFERLAKTRDKKDVLALAKQGQKVTGLKDVIKDPFVLEFLELQERPAWQERDLEQAIIDRLEAFLLELGKGFCFIARQKRITLDGDHFYVDLVFYNRLLRCFVLIDLKLGKLTHQDLGQMQMYVNYFDRYQREEYEAPTVGIVLCSDKNDAMVKITLPTDNEQIHASRYQLYMPTENELRIELARQREDAERSLRPTTLATDQDSPN